MKNYRTYLTLGMSILIAVAATGVSSASAAEFHCSVEPCKYTLKPDGTGKTAHQNIQVQNKGGTETVSFTCNEVSGEATAETKATSSLTVDAISYQGCAVNGSAGVTIAMNGCKFKYGATGTLTITGCTSGKKIEIVLPTGCTFTIGEQGPQGGVEYQTIGEEAKTTTEITLRTNVSGLAVTADGTSATCLIKLPQELEAKYTTGNALLTGEAPPGRMVAAWWK